MPLKIFNKNQKLEILNKLKKQFGINEIPGTIIKSGTERLFLYQGDLTPNQIYELERTLPIERVGVYFAKLMNDNIRLSIEGTQILQNQITKNIFELDEEQTQEWMMGSELLIATGKQDFLIMKHNNEFLGTGKASAEKISNFIPKNRRLKRKD